MFKHADIWHAIDRLAARYNLSPSGLARRAGLDPTTFNKSKRITREAKRRWPSTESIAKILDATGASLAEFVSEIETQNNSAFARHIPVIGYAQAGAHGYFDDAGYPVGTGWDDVLFPHAGDPQAYALRIAGESMQPVFRDGDTIVVSPNSNIQRGDRVVIKTTGGEVMAKELLRQSAGTIELASLNHAHPDRALEVPEVAWVARIVWVSQ